MVTNLNGDDGGQVLVLHFDGLGRPLRRKLVVGRHRRHDLADVLDLEGKQANVQ